MENEEVKREQFDTLSVMLTGAYKEISELSKKRPDGLLNEFKMKDIRRILKPVREMLKDESSCEFLENVNCETAEQFTYSDMAIILNHYIEAMHKYRGKYYSSIGDWKL